MNLRDSTIFPLLLWLAATYVVYMQLLPNIDNLKSIYFIVLIVATYVTTSFFVVLKLIFPNMYSDIKNKGAIVEFNVVAIPMSCLFMLIFIFVFDINIKPTFRSILIHNIDLTMIVVMLSIAIYDTEEHELVFIKNNSILMSAMVSVYNIIYVLMYYK